MSFTTTIFLFCFLPISLMLYYGFPNAWKQKMMILLSLLFYAWGEPMYVFGLLGLILYCYLFGIWIDQVKEEKQRNVRCIIACSFLIFLFFYFKYYETILYMITDWLNQERSMAQLIMPLGLSFVLFQALSYLIDIKRNLVAVREPWQCACYITFFPKLLMGPIMPYHLFCKENQTIKCSAEALELGSKQFVLGFAQKLILADTFAQLHTLLSSDTSMLGGWLSSFAYTFQILFDFGGYSLMAIGIAHMFGYELMENFHHPYLAHSIKDFWRRWHISLSRWFRDYVYIPLGGNRKGSLIHIRNLFIVWILTGLWHGNTLNFLIWGLYYGSLIIIETYVLPHIKAQIPEKAAKLFTFLLVNLGWVIFANPKLDVLLAKLGAMLGMGSEFASTESSLYLESYIGFFIIAILWINAPILRKKMVRLFEYIQRYEIILYTILFVCAICFLLANGFQGFLYAQF